MSSVLATLALVTMLVACASPYGESDSVALPDRSADTDQTEPVKKKALTAPAPDDEKMPVPATTSAPPPPSPSGPPPAISFSWNKVSPTAEYSFDVFLKNHDQVRPCISVDWIHRELSTTFRGSCPSSEQYPTIAMSDIEGFQICSAENADWSNATCTKMVWDGVSSSVMFDN